MTKIEHTKTHRIVNSKNNFPNGQTIDYGTQVLVTDAELVLVECEEVKHAILHNIINKNGKFYKPIYISRTEKIVDGDFYYDHINNLIKRFDPMYDCLSSKDGKVLALPEHFSPQQLQDIVDGKLKEGKCLVECETKTVSHIDNYGNRFLSDNPIMNNENWILFKVNDNYLWVNPNKWAQRKYETLDFSANMYSIKLNPHITIYPVEEKMYTRKEFETIAQLYGDYREREGRGNVATMTFNKWFEQNVK